MLTYSRTVIINKYDIRSSEQWAEFCSSCVPWRFEFIYKCPSTANKNSEPNQVLHERFRNIPHRLRDNQRISVNISKIYVYILMIKYLNFWPYADLDSSILPSWIFADTCIYPRKIEVDSTRSNAFLLCIA